METDLERYLGKRIWRVNKKNHAVVTSFENGRLFFKYRYSTDVNNEIRETLENRKYHGYDAVNPRKIWSAPITMRNIFILDQLLGRNPYLLYDLPIPTIVPFRDALKEHQIRMLEFCVSRRRCLIAGEMGIGKTLAVIEAIERVVGDDECLYLAPKSALFAVNNELRKWKYQGGSVTTMTYEKFVIEIKKGVDIPRILVLDEISKLKNPGTKRWKAVMFLVEKMIAKYGNDCWVIGMTGTPAGKSPVDWWGELEVLCPGFLRERDTRTLTERLARTMDSDGEFGGNYQTIIDWNDDVNKCASCSNLVDHRHHDEFFKNIFGKMEYNGVYHPFKPSINEVAKMKDRMEGIVLVVNKEDVCDLPDKIMEQVRVQPSTHQLELAQMLTQYAAGAEAMIRLRCLSDGFQYVDQETGSSKVCSQCNGDEVILHGYEDDKAIYGTCGACDGTGVQLEVKRIGQATDICPKDDYIKAVLEEQEEQGRIVIWGAFKWTIDHIIELCHGEGWGTIRVDGRGREARDHLNNVIDCDEVLRSFDNGDPDLIQMMRKHPKVAFVGNPGAGGMGLTLHTAKKAVYYSNTFHGESRIQSVDRIHRIGMNDLPATIVDLICLPVDLYVLQNLGKKATLENLTMHRVREALELDISNIPLFQ